MKKTILNIAALTILAAAPTGHSEAQQLETFQSRFYTPRHVDFICPPDYRTAREQLEQYLEDSRMVPTPTIHELIEDFGALPISMADVEVLSDDRDARACTRLNKRFNQLIELKVRLWEHAEPEYVYDISYYSTPDFYFVALGGGFLIQEDPLNPENERLGGGNHYAKSVYVFDKALNEIHSREIREMIERGEIQPATDW